MRFYLTHASIVKKSFIYMKTGELTLMGADCLIPTFLKGERGRGGVVFELFDSNGSFYVTYVCVLHSTSTQFITPKQS